MEGTKTFSSVLSLAVYKGTLYLPRPHNLTSVLSWWITGSCSCCLSALHSCFSKGTYFKVLSWVIFSPFIFGKFCTPKCLDKTILCSWTRLYFVVHAQEFSWQLPTTADCPCCSLVLGLPWPSYKLLDTPSALHVLPLMPYSPSYGTHHSLFQ